MNTIHTALHTAVDSSQKFAETLQDQFGRKLAARLSQGSLEVPHDISERLRVARTQAMAKRKKLQPALSRYVNPSQGAATLSLGGGNEPFSLWGRMALVIPLIALLAGLVVINFVENDIHASELAEVDAALLIDDLPPSAYVDPGFTQFLKANNAKPQ